MRLVFLISIISLSFYSCNSDDNQTSSVPKLIFKFKFDPNQDRLNNFGAPQSIPEFHAAQTPTFNSMGAHYIELSENGNLPAYEGTLIHESPKTTEGGAAAIDFDEALYATDGEEFYSIDIDKVTPGEFEYLRISLSYQNYTINFRSNDIDLTGTIASFVGQNTFIKSYQINDQTVDVNGNKAQGYWAFETDFPGIPIIEGQVPAGGTTVPNPISDLSPIPIGSCLVSGKFETPLVITGEETSDIVVVCSVSINNSFEWKDNNSNGTFEPTEGDVVVDMGIRGLIPIVE